MNKARRLFSTLFAAFAVAGLAGCSSDKASTSVPSKPDTAASTAKPSGEVKEYVMEAEYIDLTNARGAGLSSDQSGVDMIYGEGTAAQKELGWSNGYYIGYTYTSQTKLDFVFTASEASSATFILRLGSELGDLNITADDMELSVNSTPLKYNSIYVTGSESMAVMKFYDKTVATNVQINKGQNTFSLAIKDNKLGSGGGRTGGPTIDCLKLQSKAELTWEDHKDNPDNRGQI